MGFYPIHHDDMIRSIGDFIDVDGIPPSVIPMLTTSIEERIGAPVFSSVIPYS